MARTEFAGDIKALQTHRNGMLKAEQVRSGEVVSGLFEPRDKRAIHKMAGRVKQGSMEEL